MSTLALLGSILLASWYLSGAFCVVFGPKGRKG